MVTRLICLSEEESSPSFGWGVVHHGGLPAEAQVEEGRLRLLPLVIVLVLVPEVGEEASGGAGSHRPPSAAVNAVAAALAVDLGERGVRVLALQVLLVERVLPVVELLLQVLLLLVV